MVGFAGETDEEFSKSVDFVKRIRFARAHIFAYSRRAGTVADGLPNQVTNAVKRKRAGAMALAAKQTEKDFLNSQVGGVFPVLFETEKNGVNEGYTPNYTRVCVEAPNDLKGQIFDVRITGAFDDYVIGEIV